MSSYEFFRIFLDVSNWNIQLNILFILACGIYLLMVKNVVHAWKKICFLFGMLVYYISFGSPLALLSHELFSIHMLQMSLHYFVVPLFLLLGAPSSFIVLLQKQRIVEKILRYGTHPLISLVLFNGLITLYHVPIVFDTIMSEKSYHYISHFLLLCTSFFMWWPILGFRKSLNPLQRIGLIFGNGILLTPACAMITFTDKVFYKLYSEPSLLVPVISPLHDQQLGGVIMKITQEVVYISAICFVFFSWVRSEREKDVEEIKNWKQGEIREGVIR